MQVQIGSSDKAVTYALSYALSVVRFIFWFDLTRAVCLSLRPASHGLLSLTVASFAGSLEVLTLSYAVVLSSLDAE